jgi:predicted AlkP superfamily phosphohydrolase/phosphomutase
MTDDRAHRVVIIGLDGADWTLLRPLFADGAMPTLKAFVESGVSAPLESVLPTNSMSAWTSLMTGVNPGKHGIFDFVRKTETPFRTVVTNSSAIRFPTIWETLTGQGLSSCVIDMPPLHPPFPINGVMLGGIAATAATRGPYAWPAEAAEKVERAVGDFLPDVPWVGKAGRQEELVADLVALVENRRRVTEVLLKDRPVDLFCTVFVATDRAQHVFWQDLTEQGPQYALARKFYVALDEAVARLLEHIDTSETDVLIVSDHGFRPLIKTFDVNLFLQEAGLMRWRWRTPPLTRALRLSSKILRPLSGRIDEMLRKPRLKTQRELLPQSLAYSDIADGINVNLAGRESAGRVPQSEFDETRDNVASRLLEFRDPETGDQVVRRLIKREEYFHGPYADEAPDLVAECGDGYAYNSGLPWLLFRWTYCQGVHSRNGIIAGLGPHFRRSAEVPLVSILDVAPTVLSLLGVPVPEGTDGRVAEELLVSPVAPAAGPPTPPPERRQEPGTYSEEEEERVRERLRGLGYIE